jgi:hypothetical protein
MVRHGAAGVVVVLGFLNRWVICVTHNGARRREKGKGADAITLVIQVQCELQFPHSEQGAEWWEHLSVPVGEEIMCNSSNLPFTAGVV